MKTVHTTFDGSDGSDANNAPAVVIDNVSKKFGDTIAVDELSLTVPRGCIVSLLGPNGAGKTTTIEMCEGFTQPTSGQISVLGMDPATQPDKVRQRIGMMLQGGGGYSGLPLNTIKTHMIRNGSSISSDFPSTALRRIGVYPAANSSVFRLPWRCYPDQN